MPFIIAVILMLASVAYCAYQDDKKFEARGEVFMAKCLQDHKKYECQALWDGVAARRAAESAETNAAIAAGIAAGK